ncbi:dynamin family protein [Paenibacillus sp. NPDC056722]|uniref:dynamin family protein n=1 Tax=Paenibacillus sp. NPDC056722 TaxID=3345924 RepID=UPI0036748ABF
MGAEQAKAERKASNETTAGTTAETTSDSETTVELLDLKELSERWGEDETGQIFGDLLEKEKANELTIAFCGHFSAGKSSMINKLCGSTVLPSGPVPTSANIVSIRSGTPRVLIYPRTGADGTVVPWETTQERLQEYCRDGGEYSAIEVWEDAPLLGSHGVLMDTPGVDSTDDGHQTATRSALHLADVVFYVMDYNHVQSENNLAFAKNLSDWGKPLYLIINQIDKHREREISITEYQKQLESAFHHWGIKHSGMLFTSLKVKEHPLNQWEELLKLITKLLSSRQELLQFSLSRSIHHTGEALLASYREEQREEREQWTQQLDGTNRETVERELTSLEQEKKDLEDLPEHSRQQLRSALENLLGNANLMPADVREGAGAYVESMSPGFRRGLFFTAAKREKEQSGRLAAWHALLTREVSAQIEWHTGPLLREWAEALELWSEDDDTKLKEIFPAVSPEWLAALVKPGSGHTGEALLNLCRSLAAEIKSRYRRAALDFGDELLSKLPPLMEERRAELARREADLAQQVAAAAALAALDRAAEQRAAELAALLPPRRSLTPGILPEVRTPQHAPAAEAARDTRPPLRIAAAQSAAPDWAAGAVSPAGGRRRLSAAAGALAAASELLRGEPAMASAARSLAARAKDLAGGRFTLALFGAFSAGKSSFANALLGEEVLPVSPHPATAAVNRILAPEGDFRHASAVVTMKSQADVWDDITHSFSVLGLGVPQPESWSAALSSLPLGGIHPSALPHAGFLRAAAAGWKEAEPLLGTVRTVGLEEYRQLVAEETRACFVQGIDLYYACPLTESGIVLVDTPGADSLHARHTGVTFGYMKEADAIVFVTYYNHAFSKADRGLLAQLGRIKDSFALDKMFFIINASDLASGEEELEEVRGHVVRNLREGGLHAPRIYALSSLLALEGKTSGDRDIYESSRFQHFEQALSQFAGEELPQLSLAAAQESLASVVHRAEEWRALASREESQREAEAILLKERMGQAEERLVLLQTETRPINSLRREGEELLYHVRQRIGFTFGRFFQESFHPSLLREEAGNLKEIFSACGAELWRTVQRELEQELWATTLRLEAAGNRLVHEAVAAATAELPFMEGEAQLVDDEEIRWSPPAEMDLRLQPIHWTSLWGMFKSPRQFFEGGGRDKVKSAVEPLLKEAITVAVAAQEPKLLEHYAVGAQAALNITADRLRERLSEQEEAMTNLQKGGDSAERWGELALQLRRIGETFDN